MKKCFKQHLSALLASVTMGVSVFGNILFSTPITAAAVTTTTATTAGQQTSTVTYESDSTFSVTIPKAVIINSDKTGKYTISVKGDLLANQKLTVTPDSTVTMSIIESQKTTNGKSDVTATVSQQKTSWAYNECSSTASSTTGTITATGLSAGSWTGALNFTIACK